MGKEVPTCAQRSAKAIFLAHPMCVAQQRPGAPQGKHYRAEQIPQQLRRIDRFVEQLKQGTL